MLAWIVAEIAADCERSKLGEESNKMPTAAIQWLGVVRQRLWHHIRA
jgi:hypothetical protein